MTNITEDELKDEVIASAQALVDDILFAVTPAKARYHHARTAVNTELALRVYRETPSQATWEDAVNSISVLQRYLEEHPIKGQSDMLSIRTLNDAILALTQHE